MLFTVDVDVAQITAIRGTRSTTKKGGGVDEKSKKMSL
jgi:hypothetical protein